LKGILPSIVRYLSGGIFLLAVLTVLAVVPLHLLGKRDVGQALMDVIPYLGAGNVT